MISPQIQPPQSSSSFRREFWHRPAGYRTPSPPLYAVEPISPLPSDARLDDSTSWISNRKRKRPDQQNFGTASQHPSHGVFESRPAGLGIINRPPQGGDSRSQFPSRAPPSALDVFATVATSPSLEQTNFRPSHFPPSKDSTPNFPQPPAFSPSGYQPRSVERSSKRSRSEQIDFRTLPQNVSSRPATSHMPPAEWAPRHAEGTAPNGYHRQYNPGQTLKSPNEASVLEAELLLSFSRAAHYSPPQRQDAFASDQRPLSYQSPHSVHPPSTIPYTFQASSTSRNSQSSNQPPLFSVPASLPTHEQSNHDARNGYTAPNRNQQSQHIPTAPDAQTDASAPKRTYKGWPKGKPRGPRNANGETKRNTKNRGKRKNDRSEAQVKRAGFVTSKGGLETISGGQAQKAAKLEGTPASIDKASLKPRRNSIVDFSQLRGAERGISSDGSRFKRQNSAPPNISLARNATHTSRPAKKSPPATPCPACSLIENSANGYNNSWIKCNGCKEWFHAICAGFKTEREIRDVDKYFCKGCEAKHGTTTFVRKSSRAHASVDYAGLNEGTVRTAIDVPEHHYIQPIKDGTIEFNPETFPRMRPELITKNYFERCGSFTEPVLIPACWNARPSIPGASDNISLEALEASNDKQAHDDQQEYFSNLYKYDCVVDEGQDKLGMVIPQGLTVRRCAELYGPEERVEVIDVKIQEGEDKRWNMRQWADYYEAEGEKPVRNVISLEVSQSRLGRLIKRPQVVRDLDLQDSVWPQDEVAKGNIPKVQFYCLMSVADCYTDFHIDFGGSSVYYHILKGRKTFFFIPPKTKHLKMYEEWCKSSNQNNIFLGNETGECYRVDLYEGDTMLIPSGWIHAVWTPENSLVIGGNFLTRMHYGMQLQINEIEKNTGVARKFRYPHFQKVLWYTLLQYLEQDPLPSTVAQQLCEGKSFERETPIYNQFEPDEDEDRPEYYNARYYSESELNGLHDLLRYIHRTVMVSLGKIPGIAKKTQDAVVKSLPKGFGDHLELAKTFAMWIAWKRGNEEMPSWAHPDAILSETEAEKKVSAAAMKQADRDAAYQAFKASGDRRSLRPNNSDAPTMAATITDGPESPEEKVEISLPPISNLKQSIYGPRRVACDACRQRRIRCKHKPEEEYPESGPQQFGIKQIRYILPAAANEDFFDSTSTIPPLAFGPQTSTYTDTEPSATTFAGVVIDNNHMASLAPENNSASKKSRTKACEDCRKSKRRCVHDERGRIDPVKASEPTIPRHAAKRHRSDSNTGPDETKRIKSDPDFAGGNYATHDFGELPDTIPIVNNQPNGVNSGQASDIPSGLPWQTSQFKSSPMNTGSDNEPHMETEPLETGGSAKDENSPVQEALPSEDIASRPVPSVEPYDQPVHQKDTATFDNGTVYPSLHLPFESEPVEQVRVNGAFRITNGAIDHSSNVHSTRMPSPQNKTTIPEMGEIEPLSPSRFEHTQTTPKANGGDVAQKTPAAGNKHPSRERKQVERYSDTKQVETPKFNARAGRQKSTSSTPSTSKKTSVPMPNGIAKDNPTRRSVSRETIVMPTTAMKSVTPPKSGGIFTAYLDSPSAGVAPPLSNSALSEEPEDESLRLARELQEQEFGLRRRISR